MIDSLQPYPEYKESEHTWLGRVPQHWRVMPNRTLFAEVKERDHPDEEMLSVTITQGVIRQKSLLEGTAKKDSSNLDRSAYKLVCPGDIAYNKMRAWQGAIGASELRGIVSPAYVVMRLREERNLPRYFHYIYRTTNFAKEAERWSYGITSDMWSLRPEHFKMIYTPEPPPEEQAAIVRFLEEANGPIERAIRAKKKLIGLLTEQKQAIIHRVVTRGLDPTVPLKRSRIPGLDNIPQPWEARRLKFVVNQYGPGIQMGPFGSSLTSLEEQETGYRLYGQENTISGDFSRGTRWLTEQQFIRLQKYKILPGDIVLTRKGSIGKARIVPDGIVQGIADSDTVRVRFDRRFIDLAFMVEVLHSAAYVRNQLEATRRGAILGGLNSATIGNIEIAFPPLREQSQLIRQLQTDTRGIAVALQTAEKVIELLQEYRTRLVADVVTGKLDVRAVANHFPAQAKELSLPIADGDLADESEGQPTTGDSKICEPADLELT